MMMRPRVAILSLAVLIGVSASLSPPPSAVAGDAQMQLQAWEFNRSNDAGRVTGKLTFGVPRTGPAPSAPARLAQAPASPSFSCSGRLNRTELRICENTTLAGLDRKIASIYSWLRGRLSPAQKRELRNDQRQWLRQRDRCGADDACIERELYERMAYLNEDQ